jgi:hypothetical protein
MHIDKSDSDVVSSGINDDHPKQQKKQTYPTMLKLISGTLVGGANYSNIYLDCFYEDDINSSSTNDSKPCKQNSHTRDVPTLPEIARKVAKLEKIQHDEKQYISYETIACTFLLGLVKDGRDPHTNLGAYVQQSLGGPTITDIQDIVTRLKARGGREQMLMFLTGPARSGKSSALMVAQHFFLNFVYQWVLCGVIKHFYSLRTQDPQHHCLVVLQYPRPPSSINTVHSVWMTKMNGKMYEFS